MSVLSVFDDGTDMDLQQRCSRGCSKTVEQKSVEKVFNDGSQLGNPLSARDGAAQGRGGQAGYEG